MVTTKFVFMLVVVCLFNIIKTILIFYFVKKEFIDTLQYVLRHFGCPVGYKAITLILAKAMEPRWEIDKAMLG